MYKMALCEAALPLHTWSKWLQDQTYVDLPVHFPHSKAEREKEKQNLSDFLSLFFIISKIKFIIIDQKTEEIWHCTFR